MNPKTNVLIVAVLAAGFTIYSIDSMFAGLTAGYDEGYAFASLLIPMILWFITADFYKKYQRGKLK